METQNSKRCNVVSFLTAFITLATQILVFRIVAAKLYNHYAFLVISMTMLGFALSGVILAVKYRFIENYKESIHRFAYYFVVSLLLSTILFYHLPLDLDYHATMGAYSKNALTTLSMAGLFVIPFTFCGLILGVLLAHPQLSTRKIYSSDLIGSALGALLIIFFISVIGVERSLLFLSALYLIGINIAQPQDKKAAKAVLAALLLFIAGLFPNHAAIFRITYPSGTHLTRDQFKPEHFEWDPVARIEVSKFDVKKDVMWDPSTKGADPTFLQSIQKALTQNNTAGTYALKYDGNRESLRGIEETMYYAAYPIADPAPKVCVIGVGGGTDILTALYANATSVTGVEINGATHKIWKHVYRDYFKHWVNDPRVRLVHDEGRHYLEKTDELYDVLQLTGVDSYSGTMAATNMFSENYLYTKEAVKLYLRRIKETGTVSIIRMEYPIIPSEMLRILTMTVEALREEGFQEPHRQIAMITSTTNLLTTLLIKKIPFTEKEIQTLKDWTARSPLLYVSYPGTDLKPGQVGVYQHFLSLKNPRLEKKFIATYPFNVTPTVDDLPFFYRQTKWAHLDPQAITRVIFFPHFEYNILLLLGIFSLISVFFIYMPLRYLLRSQEQLQGSRRFITIFASIGLGYLFIEMAYMQKLGLFLGHPNYSVAIVLSGLLLSTGIGSMYYKEIVQFFRHTGNATCALALIILAQQQFIFPVINKLVSLDLLVRGLLAYLLIFPIGLLLGIYMPDTIDHLKKTAPHYVPWGWGINGIFSVSSPVLAMAISATFGISFLLICSIPFYLAAGSLLHRYAKTS